MPRPWRTWRWLALAVLVHVLLAGTYALRTPAWEGPDENDHAYYAWFLSVTGRQPTILQSSAATGRPAREEAALGHHPPLYYAALAGLTALAGCSDHAPYWSENPHWNEAGHPARHCKWQHGLDERPPVSREMRVLWWLRGFSVVLGALSLALTWLLARALFPARRAAADAAVLILASVPQWAWMHGVLDNGNLATALSLAWCWWLAQSLRREALRLRDGALLGAVLGLALLTKLTALFLLPLLAGIGLIAAWRWPGRRARTLAAAGLAVGLALAIAGPWFWHNWQLYADPLALAPHATAYATNTLAAAASATGADLEALRWTYLTGDFLRTTLASAWAGIGWSMLRAPRAELWVVAALAAAAVVSLLANARALAREGGLPLLAGAGAVALTIAGLVKFNLTFIQPQGRYLFPAFGVLAVLAGAALPAAGVLRAALLAALVANAVALQHLAFLPALQPGPAPGPLYASFLAGLAAPAPTALTTIQLEAPAAGERLSAAPTFRWRDATAEATTHYTVHLALPDGQAVGTFETMGLAVAGGEWTIGGDIWRTLPTGVPLRWRVRRVADRGRNEAADEVAASGFRDLVRIE